MKGPNGLNGKRVLFWDVFTKDDLNKGIDFLLYIQGLMVFAVHCPELDLMPLINSAYGTSALIIKSQYPK